MKQPGTVYHHRAGPNLKLPETEGIMAENSISQVASPVKEINPIHVEFLNENTPAVRSDILAEHFNRSHKNVLRDIAKLRAKCPKSFYQLNFEPIEIDTLLPYSGGIRKDRAYLLTRDAFSLLVMGFTGSAAIRWKLKYIEAFNALEAAVLHNQTELARESGYLQGKDEALSLPVVQAERKAGYLEGLREGQRYRRKRDGLALLTRALEYRAKGLNQNEVARLLGIRKQRVSDLMARARKLGVTA